MMLVAAGLLLMLIQIILKKPNSWLVAANAATLAPGAVRMLFYSTRPRLIASYNVEHSRGGPAARDPIWICDISHRLDRRPLPVLEAHMKEIPGAFGPIALDFRICLDRDRFPALGKLAGLGLSGMASGTVFE